MLCHKWVLGPVIAIGVVDPTHTGPSSQPSMTYLSRLSLLGLAAAAVLSASAQTTPAAAPAPAPAAAPAPEAPSSSWTITPGFASQYMFRGVRLGGPSMQNTVEYDNGSLALGVWNNIPIADKVAGQSAPEIDPYGSYTVDVFKDVLSYAPGFTIYTYPNAKKANGFYKATFEPNLAVNYTVAGIKLTPKAYYDFVLKGPTLELNAAYTVPLKDANSELDFAATLGTYKWTSAAADTSPELKNYGNYWLVGVSAPFTINPASKIIVGFAYTKGSDNYLKQGSWGKTENSAAVGRGVVTLSYAYTF